MRKWENCDLNNCNLSAPIGVYPSDEEMYANEQNFSTLNLQGARDLMIKKLQQETGKDYSYINVIPSTPQQIEHLVSRTPGVQGKHVKGVTWQGNTDVYVNTGMITTQSSLNETVYHEARHIVGYENGILRSSHETYVRVMSLKSHMLNKKPPYSLNINGINKLKKEMGLPIDATREAVWHNYRLRMKDYYEPRGLVNIMECLNTFWGKENELIIHMNTFSKIQSDTQYAVGQLNNDIKFS